MADTIIEDEVAASELYVFLVLTAENRLGGVAISAAPSRSRARSGPRSPIRQVGRYPALSVQPKRTETDGGEARAAPPPAAPGD
jgi:hypothetical protein